MKINKEIMAMVHLDRSIDVHFGSKDKLIYAIRDWEVFDSNGEAHDYWWFFVHNVWEGVDLLCADNIDNLKDTIIDRIHAPVV